MSVEARRLLDRQLGPLLERGVAASSVAGNAALRDDLGITSLDSVNLVMELERELDVEIGDEELAGLQVVDDVVRLIDLKLSAKSSAGSSA
jgi:acyl carrier protein